MRRIPTAPFLMSRSPMMSALLACRVQKMLRLTWICALITVGCYSDHPDRIVQKHDDNPLLAEWSGPYGGVPPFDKIKTEHFLPALDTAIKIANSELNHLVENSESPTFENTVEVTERVGQTFRRVERMVYLWMWNRNDSTFRSLEAALMSKITAFRNAFNQNAALFSRIEHVYTSRSFKSLTTEQQRLTKLIRTNQLRVGASLDSITRQKLAEIKLQLASLNTKFVENIMADEEKYFLILDSEADLSGLSAGFISATADAATERKLDGKWVISNTRAATDPILILSPNRRLRERVWKMLVDCANHGDVTDNNAIIAEIVELRAQMAQLLGFKSFAHLTLEDQMAKTPERVLELLNSLWVPTKRKANQELSELKAMAKKENMSAILEPWDYKYYAEKVREANYHFNQKDVEPYLQLDQIRQAVFWMADELFNFNFKKIDTVPVFQKDVEVFEVSKKGSGTIVGLWYFDPFYRVGKRSGAWMNFYRIQSKFGAPQLPLVSNNTNFVNPKKGEPFFISLEDAITLFHEFGHALHGLASDVSYSSLASPKVPIDYVEVPSTMLEHYFFTPEILNRFALHHATGKPMPSELIEKVIRTRQFNSGFKNIDYLAAAYLDMRIHMLKDGAINPKAFEQQLLNDLHLPSGIKLPYILATFSHIFDSDDYSAGYYSYIWSEIYAEDAYTKFLESGGPYDRKVATQFCNFILKPGNAKDPISAFRQFRGRDVKTDALMKKYGYDLSYGDR